MSAADPGLEATLRQLIGDVPDFPTPGILFKDITPLLGAPAVLQRTIAALSAPFFGAGITHVVAMESRGFLFGVPMALALDAAFVPARKPGKLPRATARASYALEYREDILEMHADALGLGARVLLVDDVLATGGTAAAAARLVRQLGGQVHALAVLIELSALDGKTQLPGVPIHALVRYP